MENKGKKSKQMKFMEETNYKNRIMVLHDNLKRHLSTEYVYVTERKDNLENELVEVKFELEQKDKKLFKKTEQKDTRQYFSPLNLGDINNTQKDERMKQLSSDVKRLETEIEQCDNILAEIRELLQAIEDVQEDDE